MGKKMPIVKAQRGLRLVVAGGGTGGHLFPGIAIAQTLVARDECNQVLFINAGRPLETSVLARLGWPQKTITIEGIKGRSRWHQLTAALKIPTAIWESGRLLNTFGAHMVLGVGGYSAGPVVTAAWRRGIPTALHEQNQLPGVTNRMLGRLVDRVYLSFAESGAHFDAQKVKISGNPVREEIVNLAGTRKRTEIGQPFTVLIIGGSQGAQVINQAVLDALPLMEGHDVNWVHQTGEADHAKVRQAYVATDMPATVEAFFEDMAAQYQRADVVLCRAGATTVAELTVLAKPAVFIPFLQAADDHQTKNAQALVAAGAAEMIDQRKLDGNLLAQTLKRLMQDRAHLAQMSENARKLGRPDAAQAIVEDMYTLTGK